MVEHTRHVIYIVGLLTRSSTKLLAHSFLQRSKTSQKKQPMAPSGKNLFAIVLLIVIVAAGMYVHIYELWKYK
jgi:hypothetical protein